MNRPPANLTREQLLAVIATMQDQQEMGRKLLARRLHEQLGGLLAAARMELSRQRPKVPGAALEPLAEVERQIEQALRINRDVVEAMRPGLLEHFGLATALRSCFELGCTSGGLQLECELAESVPGLGPQQALALYRFAAALLQDATQAGARRIQLGLVFDGAWVILRIGQDVAAGALWDSPAGLGLRLWLGRLGGVSSWHHTAQNGALYEARIAPASPSESGHS